MWSAKPGSQRLLISRQWWLLWGLFLKQGLTMYALKPGNRKPTPTSSRVVEARYAHRRSRSNQILTLETSIKLAVNIGCILIAAFATTRLAMYEHSIDAKLRELQVALEQAEERSQQTQQQFINNFDPTRGPAIQQEQSGYTDPAQKEIVFTEESPGPSSIEAPPEKEGIGSPSNSRLSTP